MNDFKAYILIRKVSAGVALLWVLLAIWSASKLIHFRALDGSGILVHLLLFISALFQAVVFFHKWDYAYFIQMGGLCLSLCWLIVAQAMIGVQMEIVIFILGVLLILILLIREKRLLQHQRQSKGES